MQWFLARHGETEWNVIGRRQGSLDSPPTEKGQNDAARIAGLMRGRGVDHIFASPLGRALTTASVVAKLLNLEITAIDDLAEVDHGDFAGLTNDEIEAQFPGVLAERERDKFNYPFPNGESYQDADHRARQAVAAIERSGSAVPLIVSHAMITRMLLRQLLDETPSAALRREIHHGEVYLANNQTATIETLRPGSS